MGGGSGLCRLQPHQACGECTIKCLAIHHGRKPTLSNDETYSFFKIMIGHFKTALSIPTKFRPKVEHLTDQNALLEDSKGKSWTVKVSLVRNILAFREGWNQFVIDNNIALGEFVVFKYAGRSSFVVQIFGLSGCERLQAPAKNQSDVKRKIGDSESSYDYCRSSKSTKTFDSSASNCLTTPPNSNGGDKWAVEKLGDHDNTAKDLIVTEDMPTNYSSDFLAALSEIPEDPEVIEMVPIASDASNKMQIDRETNHSVQNPGVLECVEDKSPNGLPVLQLNDDALGQECQPKDGIESMQECTTNYSKISDRPIRPSTKVLSNSEKDVNDGKVTSLCVYKRKEKGKPAPAEEETTSFLKCKSGSSSPCTKDKVDNPTLSGQQNFQAVVNKQGTCIASEQKPIPVQTDPRNTNLVKNCVDNVTSKDSPAFLPIEKSLGSCGKSTNNGDVLWNRAPCEDPCMKLRNMESPTLIKFNAPLVENGIISVKCTFGRHRTPDTTGSEGKKQIVRPHLYEKVPSPMVMKPKTGDSSSLKLPDPVKFSFPVTASVQSWLELENKLPLKGKRLEKKVVLLRESPTSIWPVLYLENSRFIGFLGGWQDFASANNIKEGDVCQLEMGNESDSIFDVTISRK